MTADPLMRTYSRLPVTLVRGEGARVWDSAGAEYLDALAGIAVCGLGHAHPAVRDALCAQAGELVHVSNNYRIPQQEALGTRLAALAGHDRAFFCNSGAEANETALKIARRHGRELGIEAPTVIVCDNAFHGRTLATLSASGNRKIQAGFEPLVQGFARAPFGDLEAIERVGANRSDVVAVMVEPVQGEGGIRPAPEGFLAGLREACDRHGWLLICDEIQSGMGRTGRWFAQQHEGVAADVTTVAKALANGFPIGACLARGPAAEVLVPGSHGTTFGGNPLGCAAGLAVLDTMEREDLPARAAELGRRMLAGFCERIGAHEGVHDIRGRGLFLGLELVADREAKAPFDPARRLAARIKAEAFEAGLICYPMSGTRDGRHGDHVLLAPPFIISDDQIGELTDKLSGAIDRALAA